MYNLPVDKLIEILKDNHVEYKTIETSDYKVVITWNWVYIPFSKVDKNNKVTTTINKLDKYVLINNPVLYKVFQDENNSENDITLNTRLLFQPTI